MYPSVVSSLLLLFFKHVKLMQDSERLKNSQIGGTERVMKIKSKMRSWNKNRTLVEKFVKFK